MARSTSAWRLVLLLGVLGLAGASPPAAMAEEYGTYLPGDPTTEYTFGWSAAPEVTGPNNSVPIRVQYNAAIEACTVSSTTQTNDGPDGPVRAFRFFNTRNEGRVQVVQPNGMHNRRMIGTDLYDARKENSATILTHPQMQDDERRLCPQQVNSNLNSPSADSIFWGKHWEDSTNGANSTRAQDYDDNEWLTAPYYVPSDTSQGSGGANNPDRGKVYSLGHQEDRVLYTDPGGPGDVCAHDANFEAYCWLASITFAESTDVSNCRKTTFLQSSNTLPLGSNATPNTVGACYMHNDQLTDPFKFPPPVTELTKHVAAAVPYPYWNDWGCTDQNTNPDGTVNGRLCGRIGYGQDSNALKGESGEGTADLAGKYFHISKVAAPIFDSSGQPGNFAQKDGLCLMRTDTLGDPDTWQAWNGQSFSVDLKTGYNLPPGDSPDNHVCAPISSLPTNLQPWSLTYNRYLKKYMLLGARSQQVQYALSDDLRNWGVPQLLMDAPTRTQAEAACRDGVTYPHVIDPDDPAKDWTTSNPSGDPNFDHPGPTPDLFFNHLDLDPVTCAPTAPQGRRGSIAHLSVDLRKQRQATLNGVLQNSTKGYDYTNGLAASCTHGSYDTPEPGETAGCGTSNVLPPSWGSAYGVVNTKWNQTAGDDVWFGSAFHLPSNFFDLTSAKLIQWAGANNTYGALALNGATDELRFVRGRNGSGAEQVPLVTFGSIPTNQWVWLEVHQVFSTTAGSALTEVFMNGRFVGSSNVANIYSDTGTITSALFGVQEATATSPLAVSVDVDRSTILAAQRGALGAPATPVGLRQGAGSNPETVAWNTVSGVTGYRLYFRNDQQTDNFWSLLDDVPASATSHTSNMCGPTDVRIATYTTSGGVTKESVVSSPIRIEAGSC